MAIVFCDYSACEYWNNQQCQAERIEISDSCLTFTAHTDVDKEYRHEFWKRYLNNENGKTYRVASRGKRYEMLGFVFYTDEDDRWGIKTVSFTEEKSGLRALGGQITEENIEKIREGIETATPLMDLPEGRDEGW